MEAHTIVEIEIEEEIGENALLCSQESLTDDGRAVILTLGAFLPTDAGPLSLKIHRSSPFYQGRKVGVSSKFSPRVHNDDTQELSKGLITMDDPFRSFQRDMSAMFLSGVPTKTTISILLAMITSTLEINVFDFVLPFVLVAVLDMVVGLVPNVHPKGTARSATIINRAWQFMVSMCLLMAAQAIEYIIKSAHLNWFESAGLSLVPFIFIYMVFLGYLSRISGAFLSVFYGDKKEKVQEKFARLLPKKLRMFLGDKDITG